MQTGIIGFKSKKLDEFNSMKETNLEILVSVDMNRLVENNQTIHLIYSDRLNVIVDNKKELKIS